MKDEKQNLSNEAAESVAGGFRWPWQPKWSEKQQKVIRDNFNVAAPDIIKKYSPKSFLKSMEKDGTYSQQEISSMRSALGV